jgi:3',5'-nucleoside bisphosphate phosphatase
MSNKSNNKFDLHCHSYFSDGSLSPNELIDLAKERNLSGISITDHDTLAPYNEKLFSYAKKTKVELLTGVEISSSLDGINVHILAYGFDYKNIEFNEFLKKLQERRRNRNKLILKNLEKELNFKTSYEEFLTFAKIKGFHSDAALGRPSIAMLLVEKGFVPNFQYAFDRYICDSGPCYVKWDKFSCQEVIKNIHMANGFAVLAHPQLVKNRKALHVLESLNFDGFEETKSLFNREAKKLVKRAKERGKIITSGSDFHGAIRPHVNLGSSYTSRDVFEKLLNKKK